MSQPIGLIQLVSEEAMPSLFPILAFKPTAVVHVTSMGYERHSEPVLAAAALAHLCPPRESVRHLQLPPMPSITETHHAVKEGIEWLHARGVQPVINFTGGTKLMSIGAFYAAMSTQSPSLYVDGDRRLFVDGQTGPALATVLESGLSLESLASIVKVRTVLTAYGCVVENAQRHSKELVPVAKALLSNLDDEVRLFETIAGKQGAFASLRSSKKPARWRNADQIRFDMPASISVPAEAAGLIRRAGTKFTLSADLFPDRRPNANARHHRGVDPGQVLQRRYQFFEGLWWELAVARAIEACPAFSDVNPNLTIAKGGRLAMEEDVLAMQGLQLAYFSCKRSSQDKLVRHLEEVDASARRLGGKMTRKYLAVCHLPVSMRDGLMKGADQLHVTLLEPTEISDPAALLRAISP